MAAPALTFVVPGPLDKPTGGYGYDRRLLAELATLGWHVDVRHLPDVFPFPSQPERAKAEALLDALPAGRPVAVDGLAYAVLPEAMARLAGRAPLIALIHHPLSLETGLDATTVAALAASERAALAAAHAIVVTSPATAGILAADFGVPNAEITIAVPGTDRMPPARGSGGPVVSLLAVGSIIPRKGHVELVEALAALPAGNWTLDIVGDPRLDPNEALRLDETIRQTGLSERVTRTGPIDRDTLATRYDRADVFVLNSYYEGYGMAYAEAIAHGLPVIGTTGGAIPDTLGDAAILVPPGGGPALTAALRRMIEDADGRATLAAKARAAALRLPGWTDTARIFAGVVEAAIQKARRRR